MYGLVWKVFGDCPIGEVIQDCVALLMGMSAKGPALHDSPPDPKTERGCHSSTQTNSEQTTWPFFFQRVG